jgi:hypothetical protein
MLSKGRLDLWLEDSIDPPMFLDSESAEILQKRILDFYI